MKTKELILEASTNEVLKQQLLNNAKNTFKELCDVEFDANVEVKVLFEDRNTKYLVIPFVEEKNVRVDILNEKGYGTCTTTMPSTRSSHC
jgi:hypothetical protein